MPNDEKFDERTLWEFIDDALPKGKKEKILEICVKDKAMYQKVRALQEENDALKLVMGQTLPPSPRMTSKIMTEIYKWEEKKQLGGTSDRFILILLGMLSICLIAPTFLYFLNRPNNANHEILIVPTSDVVGMVLIILICAVSLIVSYSISMRYIF